MNELTDTDKEHIQRFLAYPDMSEAVKKAIMLDMKSIVEYAASCTADSNNDAEIGSDLRAYAKAIDYIHKGFISLQKFRKVEEKEVKLNQAR